MVTPNKFQIPKSKWQTNYKYLNAKTTSFYDLAFELELTFELCHLSLRAPTCRGAAISLAKSKFQAKPNIKMEKAK
jgi:hypothetical protein